MIVNEPLGAAEYDDDRPFGLAYHGVLNQRKLTVNINGTAHDFFYNQGGAGASQLFDLNLPPVDTPKDMADKGMKFENYALITHGNVGGQAINGSIYHSDLIGNWIVSISGMVDTINNTAELQFEFKPFGYFGDDPRTPTTQQVHLADAGQTQLRQALDVDVQFVNNTTVVKPLKLNERVSNIPTGSAMIQPFYASKTGAKVSIGVLSALGNISPQAQTYGLRWPTYQTYIGWFVATITDAPDGKPKATVEVLFNNLQSLGFEQTRYGGDRWFEAQKVPDARIARTAAGQPPPPLAPPCSEGASVGPVRTLDDTFSVVMDATADVSYREEGFIDRVVAVYFDEQEQPTPLLYTSYKTSEQTAPEFLDTSFTARVTQDTTYNCIKDTQTTTNWRVDKTPLNHTGSGALIRKYKIIDSSKTQLKMGTALIADYGYVDEFVGTLERRPFTASELSGVQYQQYLGLVAGHIASPPLEQDGHSRTKTVARDGQVCNGGGASEFQAFSARFFDQTIAWSALTTAYHDGFLGVVSGGHGFVLSDNVPTVSGQPQWPDKIRLRVVTSKGDFFSHTDLKIHPLGTRISFKYGTNYGVFQGVVRAAINPKTKEHVVVLGLDPAPPCDYYV